MALKLPEYVNDKHTQSIPQYRKNYTYFINNLMTIKVLHAFE